MLGTVPGKLSKLAQPRLTCKMQPSDRILWVLEDNARQRQRCCVAVIHAPYWLYANVEACSSEMSPATLTDATARDQLMEVLTDSLSWRDVSALEACNTGVLAADGLWQRSLQRI